MHKKIIICSIIMSTLQLVIGGLMIANILNSFQHAKYIGILWVSLGVFTSLLTVLTFLKMKLVWIDRLFATLTISLIAMLATCWVNPLTSIAIVIYIPITFMYLMGIAIRSKI
ncbi:hypothetical protein MYTO111405_00035 [Mycoplasma todarodis]